MMWRSLILALTGTVLILPTPTLCTYVNSTPPESLSFSAQKQPPRFTNEDSTSFRPFDRDDCVSCFEHVVALEETIQALKRNIIDFVPDASLRERLLDIRPQFNDTPEQPDPPPSASVSPHNPYRRRRTAQVSSKSSNEACVQYPSYVQQGQCTICGGNEYFNRTNNTWSAACEGRCLQEANKTCTGQYRDYFENDQECVTSMMCIDCSVISPNPIEQVPCPPDDSIVVVMVILLLDNNHRLNLTGAFGYYGDTPGVYANEIAAISLSNTTLNGSQFNFENMLIFGTFNMSSSTISDGITAKSAFALTTMYGDFDMSSSTVAGPISHNAFYQSTFNGFNMSWAHVGNISHEAFYQATINGNFDMSGATVSSISHKAFYQTAINGNFDMSSATLNDISTLAFYGTNIDGDFNMSSVTIAGGIGYSSFGGASITFDFDMSSANISGGITTAFQGTTISGRFGMNLATISGGITQFAFANSIIGGDLIFTNTTFVGDVGIQAGVFAGVTVSGVLNASGASFPNDTLPVQMLYGLQVNGVDFSNCNLKMLDVKSCNGSCGSTIRTTLQVNNSIDSSQLSQLEGGPFTGMAMPIGIGAIIVNLSHNNLVEIRNVSLLGIAAATIDVSHNQISAFHPYWFQGIPNAQHINTTGNPSTCERKQQNSLSEGYTYQGESASFVCVCGGGTSGTGNFCANYDCTTTLVELNAYSLKSMDRGTYVATSSDVNGSVRSLGKVQLRCPTGRHPNNASAVVAECLGGAFKTQVNQCVVDAWFTADRIIGVVFGVLFFGAIIAYFLLLYPERRKRKRLASVLTLTNNEVELKQNLLYASNCSLEESRVRNSRMLGAWKIDVDDINFGDEIASGAFGVVHEGEFGGLRVAVKVLKTQIDETLNPDIDNDFERECETLMAIRHTCLLIFYGAGITSDNHPFMVTELMSRGSLKNVLADETQELPWGLRQKFALQIAKAMKYLHELGVVHRDLKSDNCLVNDQLDVKVCDFGTSKFLTAGQSSFEHTAIDVETMGSDSSVALSATMTKGVGTVLWMAPELFVGGTKYKLEVDMYSYGIILWELATREIPWNEIKETEYILFFEALNLAMKNDQRPCIPDETIASHPEFVLLMQQCWATDPDSRPTFEQVVQALV